MAFASMWWSGFSGLRRPPECALDHAVADLVVAVVVPHDDGERYFEFGGGHQFLDGEHQAAVADQADDVMVGFGEFSANGGGEGEPSVP